MGVGLQGKQIALFIDNGFEDADVVQPLSALRAEGATVLLVGALEGAVYTGIRGTQLRSDMAASSLQAADFAGFLIPGGAAPERMRLCRPMAEILAKADDLGRVIGAIGHGPQLLISAAIVRDRLATCVRTIDIDLRNAGAQCVDDTVVCDGNLVTGRSSQDVEEFTNSFIELLLAEGHPHRQVMVAGA